MVVATCGNFNVDNEFMIIYALGSNGSGQLGIGHQDDVSSPTRLNLPDNVKHDAISCIAAGGNHTLVLLKSGLLYTTGSNVDGRCTFDPSINEFLELRQATLPDESTKLRHCAATWSGSILVTDDGIVLSCGSGTSGELGLGPGRTAETSLTPVMSLTTASIHVVQLVASMAHVIMVMSDGSVMGWGNGKNGQLGAPAEVVWSPRRLAVPFPVARAACGKDFSLLLSDAGRGEILLLGPNKRDRFAIRQSIPQSLASWDQVVASWGSIFALQEQRLQGFGRDDHGQRGPNSLPALAEIAAGSEHVVARTMDGRVIVWGWGEHGNCGMPVDAQKDVKGSFNTLGIPGRVIALGAGCATSFIVTDDK